MEFLTGIQLVFLVSYVIYILTLGGDVQQIWTDIGESEADRDRMLLELERECMEVYRRKVEEAANAKSRLHQSVAAKEAELATLMAALGEHNINSPVMNTSLHVETFIVNDLSSKLLFSPLVYIFPFI